MNINLNWKWIGWGAAGILLVVLVVWFFFFRTTTALVPGTTPQTTGTFDSQATVGTTKEGGSGSVDQSEKLSSPVSTQKVFKISDGPIAGATFMQELRPTTTIARFVKQDSGHVLDLAIDSPGSVARAASNTTIPGVAKVTWETQSASGHTEVAGSILQYVGDSAVKSVILSFPIEATTTSADSTSSPQASTAPRPVRILFLPNDIISLASSPDGTSLAYLIASQGGSDGYIARADGTNPKKAFSLPLSQMTLSWPSSQALVATSKPAASVVGIALSINATSGAISPLLYASGLTTSVDPGFNQVVYKSATDKDSTTYAHSMSSNLDRALSFDPNPEQCVWSTSQASLLYCATSLSYVPPGYIDMWHQGTASVADSVIAYDFLTGQTVIVATPGGSEGGISSDIAELSVSPDDKYLMFIKKGDRSLWGIRLY
ncbi:MAG TPA: hypothetical protein VGP13_00870 [Candidatus Paceibacterota bacterium]|jgi:hypothetical protein|nr:hypothetical protein [Candidatus Paceibacterota bacterium]